MSKKRSVFISAILLIMCFSGINLAIELKLRVTVRRANIRLKPDINSQVISQVSQGTVLLAEEISGDWYRVKLPPDEMGIVVSGYIFHTLVEAVIQETPETEVERKKAVLLEEKAYTPQEVKPGPKTGFGAGVGYGGQGFMFGGNFCFRLTKNIGLELAGFSFKRSEEGGEEKLSKGELSLIPVQLSLQGRVPVSAKFTPYLCGGIGYYINSYTVDSSLTDAWKVLGFTVEEKVESTLGFHGGAGLDFMLNKNLAVNADFKYCFIKPKGSWKMTEQVSSVEVSGNIEDLNFNSVMFVLGLKYFF